MDCPKCNNKNRPGSRFCRFCGTKLDLSGATDSHSQPFEIAEKFKNFSNSFKKKIGFKTAIITIIIVVLISTTVYAAPKVKDYFEVKSNIQKVNDLLDNYKYQEALDIITVSANKWKTSSQTKELNDLKGEADQYIKDKKNFDDAEVKKKDGKFTDARDLLQKISTDFPEYSKVRDKLLDVQSKIENDLKKAQAEAKAQADAAAAAAARAEKDKQAAQAQAEAAERAKAQADAQAQEQAQAAAEAQARADALRNAQTSAYWDKWKRAQTYITSGHSNISTALSYLSSGLFTSALSYLTDALSDYGSAKNILGSDYIAENRSAHLYLQLALDNFINEEKALFNSVYYLDSSYINQATYYQGEGNRYVRLSNDSLGKY